MSLINKALKEEQRRRQPASFHASPPVAMAAPHRRQNNSSKLLFGFVFVGLVLAAAVGTFLYYGYQYLDFSEDGAKTTPQVASVSDSAITPPEAESQEANPPETTAAAAVDLSPEVEETKTSPLPPKGPDQFAIQSIVDGYSVQGIRKLGANTRVFLNGRIQTIGAVIDPAHELRLIGFRSGELIFEDRDGYHYSKNF